MSRCPAQVRPVDVTQETPQKGRLEIVAKNYVFCFSKIKLHTIVNNQILTLSKYLHVCTGYKCGYLDLNDTSYLENI